MKMDCTDCGRTCASVRDLENHRRQEHCVASCHLCGKPFFSQNHLSVHLKQVHDIGQKEDGKYLFCILWLFIRILNRFIPKITELYTFTFYRVYLRNVCSKFPNKSLP